MRCAWIDALETRCLFAGGPSVTDFKISPRSPSPTTGSMVFTVTYFSRAGIDPTSFDNRDLRISGPNNYVRYATVAGSTSNENGTQRIVRYKIPAPGRIWDSSDNGTYTVRLHGDEVFDILARSSDPRTLGRFGVNITSGITGGGASPAGTRAVSTTSFRNSTSTFRVIDLLE
jgi:hypothetical protein